MGNNIYPARAGEVLRAYILKRHEEVSMSANMATVVVERLFDGLIMLLFVFLALPISNFSPRYETIVTLFSAIFFGALVLFLALATRPHTARIWYSRLLALCLPERFP